MNLNKMELNLYFLLYAAAKVVCDINHITSVIILIVSVVMLHFVMVTRQVLIGCETMLLIHLTRFCVINFQITTNESH